MHQQTPEEYLTELGAKGPGYDALVAWLRQDLARVENEVLNRKIYTFVQCLTVVEEMEVGPEMVELLEAKFGAIPKTRH